MEVYNYLIFINYLLSVYSWTIFQILFILLYVFLAKRFGIRGERTAIFGLILLFITMFFNIFGADDLAGKIAQYVWILFAIAFVQEFLYFLKHENK